MKNKDQIVDILSQNLSFLKEKYAVKRIGLFGSVVRKQNTPDSDIDILVEFSNPVGFVHFMKVEYALEELLGSEIDLTTPNALKKNIGERIRKEVTYVN